VRLPAAAPVPSTVTPPSDITPPPREFVKRRVLAVDDEPLLLKAYRRMLSDIHVVETALGGVEGLRALERDAAYDVILCDLQMPEMSGMGFHEAVRKRWPALADRFVFVTGGAFSPDAKRFLEESTCAVIQKPFRVEDLLSLLERKSREGGAFAPVESGPVVAAPPGSLPS
jgi:CheY-like chemotaxis protein